MEKGKGVESFLMEGPILQISQDYSLQSHTLTRMEKCGILEALIDNVLLASSFVACPAS